MSLISAPLADLRASLAKRGAELHPASLAAIERMEAAPEMAAAWLSISRRISVSGTASFALLLLAIAQAAQKADIAPHARKHHAEITQRYSDLIRGAEALKTHFGSVSQSFQRPGAEYYRKNTNDLLVQLDWALNFLEASSSKLLEGLEKDLPASQKASSKVAFGKILCAEMMILFATPMYAFVAAACNAVYPGGTEATEDTVRKNYKADHPQVSH